jgi:hypothetical protein
LIPFSPLVVLFKYKSFLFDPNNAYDERPPDQRLLEAYQKAFPAS